MPTSPRGIAIFPSKLDRAFTPTAWEFNRSSESAQFLLSAAYPTHALFVQSPGIEALRADSALPVWREWLLNAPLKSAGQSLQEQANTWSRDALKDVRQRIKGGKFGIFSPAFGRFQTGSGNGDGVSVTRYLADSPILPFPGLNWHQGFQALSNVIKNGILKELKFNVTLGSGNDVVMPGWAGDSSFKTGPGNDIILSSPQLHIAQLYDYNSITKTGADEYFWNAYIYYPTSYTAKGSKLNPNGNKLKAGPGDDLIYYDSGVAIANGEEGDDILAPSFGSFNWGLDTLFQGAAGSNLSRYLEYGDSDVELYQEKRQDTWRIKTFIRGERALISPQRNLSEGQKVDRQYTSGYNYGLDGYQFGAFRKDTNEDPRITIRASNKPEGVNFGLKKDAVGKIVRDDNEINVIGGSKLLGGPGNDLFYGIDPQFYDGFQTAADGKGLRQAFRNAQTGDSTDKPPRYHAQILRCTEMFGGLGSDYFALGNPRNLEPWGLDGDSLYRISGNHDSFKDRKILDFGTDSSADIFEINLTYAGENWTNTVTSAPGSGSAPEDPTALDLASLGVNGLSSLGLLAGGFGINLPIFTAVTALGSFALSIASLVQPTPKAPISTENTYYRDPIGSWREKIAIQDWDPSDSIVIRVDPSDPSSEIANRWDQFLFSFADASDSSDIGALDIKCLEAGSNSPTTLFRLESFNDATSSGAWYGWDFVNKKSQRISKENLGFFGQVELQADSTAKQDLDLKGYQDQYGFAVEDGQRLFRWNDTGLRNAPLNGAQRLSRMKSRSERLVVQLDPMTLGYYWDPRFTAKTSSSTDPNPKIQGLQLDQAASKLWIREARQDGSRFWTSYSYQDIGNDPALQILKRRATPTWSLTGVAAQEQLITNLQTLDTEMTGGLDQVVQASAQNSEPPIESRGTRLGSSRYDLKSLNDITDIVIQAGPGPQANTSSDVVTQGGEGPRVAIVYHRSAVAKGKKFALLKTIIDQNTMFPTYGLNAKQLRREERAFGEDLNVDGLIGRMTISSVM